MAMMGVDTILVYGGALGMQVSIDGKEDTTPKARPDDISRASYPYTIAVPGLPLKYVIAKVALYRDGQKGDQPEHLKEYYAQNPQLVEAQVPGRRKGGAAGFLQGSGFAGC